MEIAGAAADYEDDGREIDLHQKRSRKLLQSSAWDSSSDARDNGKNARHAISEFWVLGVEEGVFAGQSKLSCSQIRD